MEKLIGLLERECSLVEQLHSRVTTLQHLIDDGETRQVEQAAEDVNRSLEHVRDIEALRSAEVSRLTRSHNLPQTSSLGSLLAVAAPDTRDRIRHSSDQLCALAADVETAGNRASDAADARLADIEEFGALQLQVTANQSTV